MGTPAAGFLAAIATFSMAATAVEASPLPSGFLADAIADFNVITNGNFVQGNDDQGPILVGGNLVTDGHMINDTAVVPLPQPIAGLGEVNVFGNVTGTVNVAVGANSIVLVGGTTAPAVTFTGRNAAQSVLNHNPFPYSFSDIWGQVTGLSTSLSLLSPTYTVTSTTFSGVPNPQGVAVLTVSLSELNSLSGALNFTGCLSLANPTCDAVIDVTGAGAFDNPALSYGALTSAQTNLIWNFESATEVDTDGQTWFASILAPNADVENSSAINGDVFADTVDTMVPGGNGEFHFHPFDCSDNLCGSTAPPNVPEPGSLVTLGAAIASFAGLAVIRRRRT